jgi:hypothetical protein
VNYPGLALAIAHCMRLGDLYQLACADKLLDQNPPPWSPPKAGIWARELVYIVCARTGIVSPRAAPLARGANLSTQAKEKGGIDGYRGADYTILGTKNNQCFDDLRRVAIEKGFEARSRTQAASWKNYEQSLSIMDQFFAFCRSMAIAKSEYQERSDIVLL